MSRIVIGKEAGGSAVSLDLDVLMVSRALVQASSGSGKSWAIRLLLEQTHGRVPHTVIDAEGDFHTLREKHPYVLAGGPGSDCKLDVKIAPLLARRILEHGFSSILDISEFKAHERVRFVRQFLEALIEAPRSLRRPLLVVVDEAHMFCPEQGSAESAGAVIDLMSRGRKRGLCGVLATQRISKLHKDAAAEAKNKLIGHASLDVDMKRAADELGFTNREERLTIRDLEPGEFFAFGPAITRTITRFQIGKVQTTHPEPGSRGNLMPPPAPEKLKGILSKLADLPKEADEQEGELDRLRREVVELRRRASKAGVLDAEQQVEAIREGLVKGKIEGYKAALAGMVPITDRLGTLKGAVADLLDGLHQDLLKWRDRQQAALARPAVEVRRPPLSVAVRETRTATDRPARAAPAPQEGITRPRQAILDALAWLESIGLTPGNKVQVAVVAGQSPSSSGYHNNLGALRSTGLIEYPSAGQVALTDAGRGAARAPDTPPTPDDLHRTVQRILPAPRWRILEALIRSYPNALSKEGAAIAADQSPTSSGYHNNLGALRSLGFITYPSRGMVAAAPVLFLEK